MQPRDRRRSAARSPWLVILACVSLFAFAGTAAAQPVFSKSFSPSTIGPGAVSVLTFTIDNSASGSPVTGLAFTDALPAGVTIADLPSAATTCGGLLDAPSGGNTITFSDGTLGAFATCTVAVDVTSTVVGTHMNVSGDLTSSAGNSGTSSADLTVAVNRPGFSKIFSPDSIQYGGRSTLTFTIDNTANPDFATNLTFTDPLPPGMVVAGPANASTTCQGATLTAAPGSSSIGLSGGFLLAGGSCIATVDVAGQSVGTLVNRSGELTSSPGGPLVSSGRATAGLEVTIDPLALTKNFTDDPVNPGDTVTIEFTVTNLDRTNQATSITFTDDLDATLSGLVAIGLLANGVCGAGSTLTGTSVLTLTGGTLEAEATCSFSVTLQVPAGATAGAYPNTTSSVSATANGSPISGSPATDTLYVTDAPAFTKTFTTDPVGAGDTATVEFTITNTSTTSPATDIGFTDNLSAFLSASSVASLPAPGFCGGGSFASTVIITGELHLFVSGASLGPGGSCTFSVDLNIPAGTPPGAYPNTTSDISATIDGMTQIGKPATDQLEVVGAPRLAKEFTDDPVAPGGTATLEFTIEHPANAPSDATSISFTDDLGTMISGATALGLPANDVCGAGSVLSGTAALTFTGGTLAPGSSCTFSVPVQVPASALPGTSNNQTSDITATIGGVASTGLPAATDLQVGGFDFAKEFVDDPAIPGGTTTLRFNLANTSAASAATGITFGDSLTAVLPGLAAVGTPLANVCGAGSVLAGTTTLSFVGGSLGPGETCSFDVVLAVPGGAAAGSYGNTTSALSATLDGTPTVLGPAVDTLEVSGERLTIAKEFVDDPVAPGDTATLRFTLENLDPSITATGLTFTDDLDAVLPGLAAVGTPLADICGAGSQLAGSGLLTFTGGSLPAGGSCSFDVTVQVPVAAGSAAATNVTSQLSGTISGLPVTGSPAQDTLLVDLLAFSKSFSGDTRPGGTAVLEFTIDNRSGTTAATGLAFTDDLDAFIGGASAVNLPVTDVCGTGSSLEGTSLIRLRDGSLDPGASCSFSVEVEIPLTTPPGGATNTTSPLSAQIGGAPVVGPASTAVLDVATEDRLVVTKDFTDDPVEPGGSATLEFTLTNLDPTLAATDIGFTDDLGAVVPGLVASGLPATGVCGAGSQLSGTDVLTLSGGSLPPGGSCTFSVELAVPSSAVSGPVLTNTTGPAGGVIGGFAVSGLPASADLVVHSLRLTKAIANEVTAGRAVQLEFTIENLAAAAAADIGFTDDLDAFLPGAAALDLPVGDVCGAGSILSGNSTLVFSGGTLAPGASCSFSVEVAVPADTPVAVYTNTTSAPTLAGMTAGAPATAVLPLASAIPTHTPAGLVMLLVLIGGGGLWLLRTRMS